MNHTRTEFSAMDHKESDEFDPDYLRKCRHDLDVHLAIGGLLLLVSSMLIAGVLPKLPPDSNEINIAHLRSIIHAIDPSLFPDADPLAAVTWNEPAPGIIIVLYLLCASLVISLLALSLAMQGIQLVNHYIQSRGGSAAEKSRDHQQKLGKMGRWHFRMIVEGIPVMLQIVLVLLSCAIPQYMWTTNDPAAGVIIVMALLGFGLLFTFMTVLGFRFHLIAIIAVVISIIASNMIISGKDKATIKAVSGSGGASL
ncbi:hypothetical protein BDM02DRAFT_3117028 [Thelephora ganbajun]|uniref:Uncharacterized protein n=1 Tax=Thelephora ganbajun TaxID=370292 RepID=A0ACB6ZD50_THEGA|nr:hypothetical protein BDM02DRAFT_3117028 [Thelephora ganbajun]